MTSLLRSSIRKHQVFTILTCAVFSLFMVSCKKDSLEVMDLKFPLDTYYVSEGGDILLAPNSGNKKYSVEVSAEGIIETGIDPSYWPAGNIRVSGLKKGTTDLVVKDEVSNQEVILKIHVVDPYLVMRVADLRPSIEIDDYEIYRAISDEVKEQAKSVFAMTQGDILILQRNADHGFSTFKTVEDVERGVANRTGRYSLEFQYGGPNRLTLYMDGTDEEVGFSVYAPEEDNFLKLLEFSRKDPFSAKQMVVHSSTKEPSLNKINTDMIQGTSPIVSYSFFLIKDFTDYFQTTYPEVKRVEVFQAVDFFAPSHHLRFGEDVL